MAANSAKFATQHAYDALGRRKNTTDAKNGLTEFEYDRQDQLTSVTDPRRLVTQYEPTGLGDLKLHSSPDTGVTNNTSFDPAGNLKASTDARGVLASYRAELAARGPERRACAQQCAAARQREAGEQVGVVAGFELGDQHRRYGRAEVGADHVQQALGELRELGVLLDYDELSRLTRVVYSKSGATSRTINWTYDQTGASFGYGVGRLTTAATPDASTTYRYDALGRVKMTVQSASAGNPLVVNYDYDDAGHVTSLTYPSGRVVSFAWANGQPQSITVASGTVTKTLLDQIVMSAFGPVKRWVWQFGAAPRVHERVFDAHGRLVRHPLGNLVRDIRYDDADRISGYTHYIAATAQPATTFDQVFGYDELGRLTAVSGSANWSYGYDANGNRISAGTRAYTVQANSNRLDSLSNPARSMLYDTSGNTSSDIQSGSSSNYTATYSLEGRLAAMAQGSSAGVEFGYDATGRRVLRGQWSGSASNPRAYTLYAYDQNNHLIGEYNADGTPVTEYVWLGDTPVAVLKPDGAGMQIYAVHADHLDTPRMLLDASGQVRWRWMGEPFGASPAEEQPTSGLLALQQNLRFPGQQYEAFGGRHYNHFRDYDPSIGRYVQSDPIGLAGGINTYAYANGNPLMYVDPYGLFGWADMPDVPDWLVDGAAGFGDTLSFGGTGVVRRWMGTDGAVNRCSSAYSNGEWGAIGLSLAFGGAHLGRNALNQMGRAGDLGTRVGRGVGRVFSDGRSWGAVRDTWSVAAGNGERWLAANGQSLHHWLIPQRFAEVNAGFNYMAISAGFNSWMNGSTAYRTAVEWGFRGSVAGIYGAPLTAAVSGDDCTCQK